MTTNTPTELVELGNTGLRVKPLGIGTWQWGDTVMWGYGSGYAESEIEAAYRSSIDAGIDFFDTAEMYGRGKSEQFLGRFIAADGARPVVATKFMPMPWRIRKGSLVSALRASLERLGMKQVDLYQVHFPVPVRSVATWADALADAVEAGLTRTVGVSNYSADQMRRTHEVLAKRGVPLASNQVQYSLLYRKPDQNGVMEACRELGVTLIAYSPLAKGLLTGKYVPGSKPPGLRGRRYNDKLLEQIQPLTRLLREIGEAHGGKTPSQVALNWVIRQGAVPIPGAKNSRQAEDNAGALGWQLTGDEVAALGAAAQQTGVVA